MVIKVIFFCIGLMFLNIMVLEIVILFLNFLEIMVLLFEDLFIFLYKWDKKEVNDFFLSFFLVVFKIRESVDNVFYYIVVVCNIFDVIEFYRMIRWFCLVVICYLG